MPDMPDDFKKVARPTMQKYMQDSQSLARTKFLGGGAANRLLSRTGELASSISGKARVTKTLLIGTLSSTSPYAPVHEFGGTIRPRGYAIKMKKRPFIFPALVSGIDRFEKALLNAAKKEWDK